MNNPWWVLCAETISGSFGPTGVIVAKETDIVGQFPHPGIFEQERDKTAFGQDWECFTKEPWLILLLNEANQDLHHSCLVREDHLQIVP